MPSELDALAALVEIVAPGKGQPEAERLLAAHGSLGAVLEEEPWPPIAPPVLARHLRTVGGALRTALKGVVLRGPVLSRCSELHDYLRFRLAHESVEQVLVLFLDAQCALLREEVVARGTVSGTPVPPAMIVRRALQVGAAGLVLVHNHPSGSPNPSREDLALTRRLKVAAEAVEVTLHDHLIIAREGVTSLAATGDLFR